jgi:hypothetical protein
MDVDTAKAAATDGWDYGGGATLGGADDMTDGAAGAGEGAWPQPPLRRLQRAHLLRAQCRRLARRPRSAWATEARRWACSGS